MSTHQTVFRAKIFWSRHTPTESRCNQLVKVSRSCSLGRMQQSRNNTSFHSLVNLTRPFQPALAWAAVDPRIFDPSPGLALCSFSKAKCATRTGIWNVINTTAPTVHNLEVHTIVRLSTIPGDLHLHMA